MFWAKPLLAVGAMPLWAWLATGAIAAYILAWLMFRVCVGVFAAVVASVVAPYIVLVWQEPLMPVFHPQMAIDAVATQDDAQLDAMEVRFHHRLVKRSEVIWAWCGELPSSRRWQIAFYAAAAGVGGLVTGLAKPYLTASVGSALLGAMMMWWYCSQYLIGVLWPGAPVWLTALDPRVAVAQVGALAAAGCLAQGVLSRCGADND